MPTALLVTMSRYAGVKRRLEAVQRTAPATTHVQLQTPGRFDEVPPLLRSDVDLIALDGHGWRDGENAYFGRRADLQVSPRTLRGDQGHGIIAPIVILGFCSGATDPFLVALAGALDRPRVAFVGCTGTAKHDDAALVYPPLLALLDTLGHDPDPVEAYRGSKLHEHAFGPAWRAMLLRCSVA